MLHKQHARRRLCSFEAFRRFLDKFLAIKLFKFLLFDSV